MTRDRLAARGALGSLRRVFARAWPHLRAQRRLLWLSAGALLAQAALRVIEPWPLKLVFDELTGFARADAPRPGWLPGDSAVLLAACAVSIPILVGLGALAAYAHSVGFAVIGNRVTANLRADLFRHLQALSLAYHGRARAGDLIVRVVGDIGMLRDVAVTALLPLFGHAVVLVAMLGVMFWLHWRLALLALGVAPLFLVFSARLNRRIHAVSREQRKREGALATTAAESLGAIGVVQSLSLESWFGRAFGRHNERGFAEGVRGRRLAARLERGVDVLAGVSTGLVIFYGSLLVLRRELTPGDLVVFTTYLRRAFAPLKDAAKYSGRLSRAAASGERVLAVLDEEPAVREAPGARPAPPLRGAVRFCAVAVEHDPGHPVLRDVSLEVLPGRLVAIVGPAGTGKSTLVSLLLRLRDPVSGRVEIDGIDLRSLTLESLRSQIGVVLQDTTLFAGTVGENIALGREGASAAEVQDAVRRVGCEAFVRSLPAAYDTRVGERGVTLSAGQRQLVALCRMAVRDVPILILDEPCASLDRESALAVSEAMRRLAAGRTTFLVTHDLAAAAEADVIVHLDGQSIRQCGTHAELLRSDPWYARLAAAPAADGRDRGALAG